MVVSTYGLRCGSGSGSGIIGMTVLGGSIMRNQMDIHSIQLGGCRACSITHTHAHALESRSLD